jgi:hypothetical protein
MHYPTSASTRVNLAPLWNLLDLTREGHGTEWDEQLSYS